MSSFRDKVQATIPKPISIPEEMQRVMKEDALLVADTIRKDILNSAKDHRDAASKFRYARLLVIGAKEDNHYGICTSTNQRNRISGLFSDTDLEVSTVTLNSSNANLFLSALRRALQEDNIRVGDWCAVFYTPGIHYYPPTFHGVPSSSLYSGYIPSNHYFIVNPADDIAVRHGPCPSNQPVQIKKWLDSDRGHSLKKCEFYLGSQLLEKSYQVSGDLCFGFCLQVQYE